MVEPLILIHGEDSYLVAQAAQELRDNLSQGLISELGLEEFRGADDLEEIQRSLATPPFLSVRRVVMIWDPPQLSPAKRPSSARPPDSKRKQDRRASQLQALLATLAVRAETTAACVVVRQLLPATSTAVKGIKALGGEIRAVATPSGQEVPRHVEARARARGLRLPAAAIHLLTDIAAQDMGWLEMELDKLALYSADGRPITATVARLLITAAPPQELYRLTDALFSEPATVGQRLDALWTRPEVQPPVVVGALARVLRDLISYLDPKERATWDSAPSWRVRKMATQAARAGASRLQGWLVDLAELDWLTRTGQVDARDGLEVVLARIAWDLAGPRAN